MTEANGDMAIPTLDRTLVELERIEDRLHYYRERIEEAQQQAIQLRGQLIASAKLHSDKVILHGSRAYYVEHCMVLIRSTVWAHQIEVVPDPLANDEEDPVPSDQHPRLDVNELIAATMED
jgi:hypothetical protein